MDNYNKHDNGCIWLELDDNKIGLRHVMSNNQIIHYGVYDLSGKFVNWLSTIYSLNQLEHRRKLWSDIEQVHMHQIWAWCIIVDFKYVLRALDKIGGNMVSEVEFKDLASMI